MTDEQCPRTAELERLITEAHPSTWFRRQCPKEAKEAQLKAIGRLRDLVQTGCTNPRLLTYLADFWLHLTAAQDPAAEVRRVFGLNRRRGAPVKTDVQEDVDLVFQVVRLMRDGSNQKQAIEIVAKEGMTAAQRRDPNGEVKAIEATRKRYQRAVKLKPVRDALLEVVAL